jgi:hypothetical protein
VVTINFLITVLLEVGEIPIIVVVWLVRGYRIS